MGQVIPIRPETVAALQESDWLDRLAEETLRQQAECAHEFEVVRLCRLCGLEEGSSS